VVKVIWSERASKDIQAIYNFIASDSKAAALRVTTQIVAATTRLVQFPESGRPVAKSRKDSVREIVVRPYVVAYDIVGENEVSVLTVQHGARMPHEEAVE
jgi:addiction module RelE/StbE family toxin